jgi:hypothetical protein
MRRWGDLEEGVNEFKSRGLDRLAVLCEPACHTKGGQFRDRDERLPASQEEICLMEAPGICVGCFCACFDRP